MGGGGPPVFREQRHLVAHQLAQLFPRQLGPVVKVELKHRGVHQLRVVVSQPHALEEWVLKRLLHGEAVGRVEDQHSFQ